MSGHVSRHAGKEWHEEAERRRAAMAAPIVGENSMGIRRDCRPEAEPLCARDLIFAAITLILGSIGVACYDWEEGCP
jgi:hypothetical protein